jgi:hypothetical protein
MSSRETSRPGASQNSRRSRTSSPLRETECPPGSATETASRSENRSAVAFQQASGPTRLATRTANQPNGTQNGTLLIGSRRNRFRIIRLICPPLRNRTVDLLLTMATPPRPGRTTCTNGTPECSGSTASTQCARHPVHDSFHDQQAHPTLTSRSRTAVPREPADWDARRPSRTRSNGSF